MKHAKTIKIFLIDGEPNGLMSCELSNWTGKAYKIPRIKINNCIDRDDINNPGVYMLFGKDDEGKDQIYIGEAETIFSRLTQQLLNKEFWNEAIIFVSKDENLNKAHIKYLENRLHEIATKLNRYRIENILIPNQPSISESDKAEMEEFIENIKLFVNILGHKVFEEKREYESKQQHLFYINGARGANGQGERTSEGFVVLKGSKASFSTTPSLYSYILSLREKLLKDGILIKHSNYIEFGDDYIFNSPSTAATIMLGRPANGLIEWKLKDGKTLKDVESDNKSST